MGVKNENQTKIGEKKLRKPKKSLQGGLIHKYSWKKYSLVDIKKTAKENEISLYKNGKALKKNELIEKLQEIGHKFAPEKPPKKETLYNKFMKEQLKKLTELAKKNPPKSKQEKLKTHRDIFKEAAANWIKSKSKPKKTNESKPKKTVKSKPKKNFQKAIENYQKSQK